MPKNIFEMADLKKFDTREKQEEIIKLRLPKVKTKSGRKMFSFQGALIFNKLPKDLTNETSLLICNQKCRTFFLWKLTGTFYGIYTLIYFRYIYRLLNKLHFS